MKTILKYENHITGCIQLPCTYAIAPSVADKEQERTKIKKQTFLEFLDKSRGIISVACSKVDISRSTYYVWMKNDPVFKEKVDEIIQLKPEFLEDLIYSSAVGGNFQAQKYLIEHMDTDFKKKERKQTTVNIYHHATPPEESRGNDDLGLTLDDLFILGDYNPDDNDIESKSPYQQNLIKRFKVLMDFLDEFRYGKEKDEPKES